MPKIKEVDLAKQLIKSFDGTNYEVYQEVTTPNGSADIVLKYTFLWAVEVKLGMNLTVLAQAHYNQRYFNYSSVCLPGKSANSKTFDFGRKICKEWGIGIFTIDMRRHDSAAREYLKPRLNRKALTNRIILHERMKTYAEAGNSNGDRWTPFNQTVDDLKRYIHANPGCRLNDALSEIKHHYSSLSTAQNSIRQWIKTGVIEGISLNRGILTMDNDEQTISSNRNKAQG